MCSLSQAIFIWSLVKFERPDYGKIPYPDWGVALGWCMIIFCIIWIPIMAVIKIIQAKGNIFQVSTLNSYYLFTSPSQVSLHHHLSPLCPLLPSPTPFPSGNHHAVVCEGFSMPSPSSACPPNRPL